MHRNPPGLLGRGAGSAVAAAAATAASIAAIPDDTSPEIIGGKKGIKRCTACKYRWKERHIAIINSLQQRDHLLTLHYV